MHIKLLSLLPKSNDMIIGILGVQEIILIVLIVLLLFGIHKLPEIMRNLGKGVKDIHDSTEEIRDTMDDFNPNKYLK